MEYRETITPSKQVKMINHNKTDHKKNDNLSEVKLLIKF